MKKRLEAEVFGRVQGVGFRVFVTQKFRDKLTGRAFNTKQGNLKVVAEGSEEDLKDLLNVLNKGPLFAKIEKVDYSFFVAKDEFDSFEVVRDGNIFHDQKNAFSNLSKKILK